MLERVKPRIPIWDFFSLQPVRTCAGVRPIESRPRKEKRPIPWNGFLFVLLPMYSSTIRDAPDTNARASIDRPLNLPPNGHRREKGIGVTRGNT